MAGLTSQVLCWHRVALVWIVLVIAGCFGFFGIGISTVSGQSGLLVASLVAISIPEIGGTRRQRRQLASTDSGDSPVIAASYSRFSCDLQREDSIAQQQRESRLAAERNGHLLRSELEFFDQATSGTKREREGLNALIQAAKERRFQVLYLYSVSRLARESVITMPLLKRLVNTYGIRVISLTEGLDSAVVGWEMQATLLALISERYLQDLSASVLRGQVGALSAGFSVGDYCFGYSSVVDESPDATRSGRNPRPRKRYVIDPENAEWVRKIFHWFVVDERSINSIVRQLNAENAPKDHRATTPHWRHELVAGVLDQPKYVGVWSWGQCRNVRDPETGVIRQEPRPVEETQRWVRHFPELQIIDPETFLKARQRLQENEEKFASHRNAAGRLQGSPGAGRQGPRHLLSGLIVCGACASKFVVSGSHGAYLVCPGYRQGRCTCQTMLNRRLAETLILEAIGQQIEACPAWSDAVVEAAQVAWTQLAAHLPSELATVREKIADVERRCARLIDRVERGIDGPELTTRLRSRRAELAELRQQAAELERRQSGAAGPPTEVWLREQLGKLQDVLYNSTPAAANALRKLVGGSITVHEIRQEGQSRHHLRGHVSLSTCVLVSPLAGAAADSGSDPAGELPPAAGQFEIDFVNQEKPQQRQEQLARFRQLYDNGLPQRQIAREMGLSKSRITALVKQSFAASGDDPPDGRRRRHQLDPRHFETPLYQTISAEVKRLRDEFYSDREIARQLQTTDATVAKAYAWWFTSRGLPERTRMDLRNAMMERVMELWNTPMSLSAIAAEIRKNVATVRKLVAEWHAARGLPKPDRRYREHRAD